MTDDLDKHLLNTFTRVWFSETTFSDKFCFYKGYSIPGSAKTVQDFQQHIETLPLVDTPEVSVYHPSGSGFIPVAYSHRLGGVICITIAYLY